MADDWATMLTLLPGLLFAPLLLLFTCGKKKEPAESKNSPVETKGDGPKDEEKPEKPQQKKSASSGNDWEVGEKMVNSGGSNPRSWTQLNPPPAKEKSWKVGETKQKSGGKKSGRSWVQLEPPTTSHTNPAQTNSSPAQSQ